MFKQVKEKNPDELSIRSGSDPEFQHGNPGNQANILNENIYNISNESNNDLLNEGMRENGSLGDGSRISKDDNKSLLKSLDRIPDEDKNGLIDDLIKNEDEEGVLPLDNLGGIPENDSDAPSELNESMIAHKPKKKKEKEKEAEKAPKKRETRTLNSVLKTRKNEEREEEMSWNQVLGFRFQEGIPE